MQNTIFSSSSESFIVAHVIHAGPVTELATEKQKNGHTHYFKLTTVHGCAFCKFKNEESARKSRGLLGAMLGTIKPYLFRAKGDCIDLSSIVSFGRIIELKNSTTENDKFGLPIKLATAEERGSTLWLTFKSEESGKNVRKALWAGLMSYYSQGINGEPVNDSTKSESVDQVVEEPEVVYSDV